MSEQPPATGPEWVPPGPALPPMPPPALPAPPVPPTGLPQPPPYGAPPGYGYPAPYGAPVNPYFINPNAGPPPPRGMAITALVLSLIPIMFTQVVAVILGIITLKRVGRGEARGKGMAIAALVISVVILVLGTLGLVLGDPDTRSPGSEMVPADDLGTGDCLRDIPAGDIDTVRVVDCSEPHRDEVYAVFFLDDIPGSTQAQIDNLAEDGCSTRFEKYVGTPYAYTSLETTYFSPALEIYPEDRSVQCLLGLGDLPSTGTLKNSKR